MGLAVQGFTFFFFSSKQQALHSSPLPLSWQQASHFLPDSQQALHSLLPLWSLVSVAAVAQKPPNARAAKKREKVFMIKFRSYFQRWMGRIPGHVFSPPVDVDFGART